MNLLNIHKKSNICLLYFLKENRKLPETIKIYMLSDVHFGHPQTDLSLLISHLEQAKQEGALIIDNGDFFDMRQSQTRSSIHKNNNHNFYEKVVDKAVDLLKPYAKNIIAMGWGDQEMKVHSRSKMDLTYSLMKKLRYEGSRGFSFKNEWWVYLIFNGQHHKEVLRIRMTHNSGGNSAMVSRGTVTINRLAAHLADVDIVINGHNHQAYIVPIARQQPKPDGSLQRKLVYFVRVPGYQRNSLQSDPESKNGLPHPLGCAVITIGLNPHPYVKSVSLLVE